MDSNNKRGDSEGFSLLQAIAKFLLWLGSSSAVISMVLSAFGFLVEHAYFDRLGIPRSVYQATPTEYIVTGGKFMLGIIPSALVGSMHFVMNFWWIALVVMSVVGLVRWKHWSANSRWLLFGACYGLALLLLGLRFGHDTGADYAGVAMFSFVTVAAALYGYMEILLLAERKQSGDPSAWTRLDYAARLPFFSLLFSGLIALPYLRGGYALEREYPLIEFLAKDKAFFCDLVGNAPPPAQHDCDRDVWQLIDIGKERAILRRVNDGKIYVVPPSTLNTFRMIKGDQKP